ncbi:MAG TPA: retropepsin-like aspartic protease [Caulobacteraceae bacterium]|nr:retropepsin-like aspartic protease [Caulobacteraceae bacterium]
MRLRAGPVVTIGVLFAGTVLASCGPDTTNTAAPSGAASSSAAAASGQNSAEVALEEDGGTYMIPVLVNDQLNLKFTIDSGASDVTIPSNIVQELKDDGTISNADYIGTETFILADGSQQPSQVFRIHSLKIGNLELRDVTGSIANENGQLLLGQTFLSRLSSWSIDNNRHVLVLSAPRTAGEPPTPLPPPPPNAPPTTTPTSGVNSAAPPLSAPDTSAAQAAAMARAVAYYAAWSGSNTPSAETLRPFYAPSVNHWGNQMSIDDLMQRKLTFATKWPVRYYTLRQSSLTVTCADQHNCVVQGISDWTASNPQTGQHLAGVSQFSLVFHDAQIVAENGTLLARQ